MEHRADGYETAAARAARPETARSPGGAYETTTRFADRRAVRSQGALAAAKKGRLGVAIRLALHNYKGDRGGKLTDLEVRLRHHEIRTLELVADDSERECKALAENDRLRRKLDAAMR